MLVYDAARDRVVALGRIGFNYETHEFDGQSWTLMNTATPSIGGGLGFCYDEVRQRTVLYGGFPSQTWEWDGQRWVQKAANKPVFRGRAYMAFHKARGTVMMFGGDMSVGPTNELWEWNGVLWRRMKDVNPPPAIYQYSAFAYDAERDKLIVYGADATPALTMTWEWDPVQGWQSGTSNGPSLIVRTLVYDEARRTMVLVGYNSVTSNQTWERFAGGSWVQRPTTGSFGVLVYDSLRHRMVMSGSFFSSLLAYAPVFPATLATFAPGCAGSQGIPSLSLTESWKRAWLGDTLSVTARGLPSSMATMLLGFSNVLHGSLQLPADLGAFGMPGCDLRVAVDGYVVLTGSGGQAVYAMPVPNTLALRGMPFYLQAVSPDPAGNAAGLTMSDAVAGTIGSR